MFIPIIIPIQRFPIYIKKKELEDYIFKQKKQVKVAYSIVYIGVMLVQIIMAAVVLSKLNLVYKDVGLQSPVYSVPLILVSLLLGIICLAISLNIPSLNEDKVKKLREDTDEMVTINSKLVNPKIDILGLIYLLFSVAVLVVSIILPIFILTSSV